MKVPGKAPVTIIRQTEVKNGKGRKTVRVLRGKRVISNVSKKLNLTEKKKITKREYVMGLYKPMENQTLQNLN
jgi:hypothetical protein